MRNVGRPSKYTKDQIEASVKEYLNTDLSLKEVGEKYDMTPEAVRRYVKKYREEGKV